MNKHEVRGGARYLGGKVEKTIGDLVDSRDWQITGVADQVSGAVENLFGRAQSVVGDVADATPGAIEEARERIEAASQRAVAATRGGAETAARAVRRGNAPLLLAAVAAAGGYLVGWLIHRRTA